MRVIYMEQIPIRQIPENDQMPSATSSFSIRRIETLLDGKDMVQALHRHDFFLLLILFKGSGFHEIDFSKYEVNNYSVFILRPGQVHKLAIHNGSTGFIIQFKRAYYFSENKVFQDFLRKASRVNYWPLTAAKFQKLDSLLADMFMEFTAKKKDFQEVIRANMGIFFIELLRHLEPQDTPATTPYTQEKLERFLALLEENMVSHKQVSHYANLLHLTVYQLNAITKSSLQKKASELIHEYIILEAKRNLMATTQQISQIAYQLGYEDVSYFIRFFKRHTGYSPDSFRQNFS